MADLNFSERPKLRNPVLVCAFAGWPDASDSATRAIRYLIGKFGAVKFAEINPEEFFDFTRLRPNVASGPKQQRVITWPKNEFYKWNNEDKSRRDLIIFIGTEPHLKWKLFTSLIMEIVEGFGVELMVTLGALLDAVPHTRAAPVTMSATNEKLGDGFEKIVLGRSNYEGPTGITSILIDAMVGPEIPVVSLWGHAPHYLQARPNPMVSVALLKTLQPFLSHEVTLSELERASVQFSSEVAKVLKNQPDVREYVTQLEKRYDSGPTQFTDNKSVMKNQDQLVADVEEFLRKSQSNDQEGNPPIGSNN